jgi:protein-disulfide isomerase
MEHNDSSWVDRHLAGLDPPADWQPDAGAAFARLRQRDRAAASSRKRRIWLALAASVACLAVAAPLTWNRIFPPREGDRGFGPPKSITQVRATSNFREIGSPNAPIVAEIYSDYECGHCASLFLETVPQLTADYVRTGKVRLLHRDLPLAQHRYSGLAARYANAAGRIGKYDLAVDRIFRTQQSWANTGDVDSQLAGALPPADMAKVRDMVRNSTDLDHSVDADVEMSRNDHVTQTPAMVIVANGRRQVLAPAPPYYLLKGYLDHVLETNCREDPKAARC